MEPERKTLAKGDLVFIFGERVHGKLVAQLVLFVAPVKVTPTPTPTATPSITTSPTVTADRHPHHDRDRHAEYDVHYAEHDDQWHPGGEWHPRLAGASNAVRNQCPWAVLPAARGHCPACLRARGPCLLSRAAQCLASARPHAARGSATKRASRRSLFNQE